LSDPEIEDFRLDDPTIEALFYRLNEAEVAVVMAQRPYGKDCRRALILMLS
jgi:hypothetical protein